MFLAWYWSNMGAVKGFVSVACTQAVLEQGQ